MKLIAEVEVVNRLLPSANLKSRSRPKRAQLCVGRKSSASSSDGHNVELLVSSQNDRTGTKYKLVNNVGGVFMKFVKEGKCTLRLCEPPVDICVSKADAIQLQGFLNVIKAAVSGKKIEGISLGPLSTINTKQAAKLRSKLVITSRSAYPVTTSFPPALETLCVNGCLLRKVDSRIMKLSRLVCLDLSDNHISALPDDWNLFSSLAELRLAKNHLSELPATMFTGRILISLAYLDLSDNHFQTLAAAICNLSRLSVLKADRNRLISLPSGIGKLTQLVQLTASENQLKTLPGDFDRLTLNTLDLSQNPLADDTQTAVLLCDDGEDVATLFELAARCVKNQHVAYTSADVGRRIAATLDSAEYCCQCHSACILPHAHVQRRVDLRRVSANITAVDIHGRTHVPCDSIVCSPRCAARLTAGRYL